MTSPSLSSQEPASPERRNPPIPSSNLRELVRNPLSFFLSITRQYGDVICYRPAPDTAYLINHPDYIHHVLVDNGRNYSKDTSSNQAFKKAVGPGLINFEGEAWLERRRLMQPAFHHNRLERLDGMIVEAAEQMLDRWQMHYDARPDDRRGAGNGGLDHDHHLAGAVWRRSGRGSPCDG